MKHKHRRRFRRRKQEDEIWKQRVERSVLPSMDAISAFKIELTIAIGKAIQCRPLQDTIGAGMCTVTAVSSTTCCAVRQRS